MDNNDYLKKIFYENKSKILELKFKGMTVYLNGANSPSKLASKPIRFLFFDESDKFPSSTKKEASPFKLAKERTKTYKLNSKIFDTSTPTFKTGHIWQAMMNSDVIRHYLMPCPHCGEMIEFDFKNLYIPESGESNLSNEERAELARYICCNCGCIIDNNSRLTMLRDGKWVNIKDRTNGKNPRKVAFWLNTLYSPFVNWEDIAREYLNSEDKPEELQNFVNSWLAEPWEDTILKTDFNMVLKNQTEYEEFVIPDWAKILTGGVDVQRDKLYYTIRAWGDYMTSQNITHGQVLSFDEISEIMNLEYKKKDGTIMIVELCLIDSGDQTDTVYDFCNANEDWAKPVKGSSSNMLSNFRISVINKPHSKAHGMKLILVDGNQYKDMIAGRLKKDIGKGCFMVYRGCDSEYAKQVTSEHKVRENKNGQYKYTWVPKKNHIDNHYLDCEVYSFAAADMLGVRRLHLEDENVEEEEVNEDISEESWVKQNSNWV